MYDHVPTERSSSLDLEYIYKGQIEQNKNEYKPEPHTYNP